MTVSTPTTAGQILTSAYVNNNINSGLVYIKEQTIGSGVSSVTVTDAFSADYDNYKIIVSGGTATAGVEMNLKLGATTSNYYMSFIFTAWSSTVSGDGTKVGGNWNYVGGCSANGNQANIELNSPYLAKNTRISAVGFVPVLLSCVDKYVSSSTRTVISVFFRLI